MLLIRITGLGFALSIGTWFAIIGVTIFGLSFLLSLYIGRNVERRSMPSEVLAFVALLLWGALLIGMLVERNILG